MTSLVNLVILFITLMTPTLLVDSKPVVDVALMGYGAYKLGQKALNCFRKPKVAGVSPDGVQMDAQGRPIPGSKVQKPKYLIPVDQHRRRIPVETKFEEQTNLYQPWSGQWTRY